MNLQEYIDAKAFKKLTPKEIEKGKSSLMVYGTQQPMPWSTIFTRIASGQPIEELAHMYGHGRKIALFAQLENVKVEPVLQDLVQDTVQSRQQLAAIGEANPEVAQTMMEMMNEIAPTFQEKVATFLDSAIDVATEKLKSKYLEPSDLDVLVRAVQRATDTTGHTQRHASASQMTNNIQVTEFDVVLDYQAPDHKAEIATIEAQIEEAQDENSTK